MLLLYYACLFPSILHRPVISALCASARSLNAFWNARYRYWRDSFAIIFLCFPCERAKHLRKRDKTHTHTQSHTHPCIQLDRNSIRKLSKMKTIAFRYFVREWCETVAGILIARNFASSSWFGVAQAQHTGASMLLAFLFELTIFILVEKDVYSLSKAESMPRQRRDHPSVCVSLSFSLSPSSSSPNILTLNRSGAMLLIRKCVEAKIRWIFQIISLVSCSKQ